MVRNASRSSFVGWLRICHCLSLRRGGGGKKTSPESRLLEHHLVQHAARSDSSLSMAAPTMVIVGGVTIHLLPFLPTTSLIALPPPRRVFTFGGGSKEVPLCMGPAAAAEASTQIDREKESGGRKKKVFPAP